MAAYIAAGVALWVLFLLFMMAVGRDSKERESAHKRAWRQHLIDIGVEVDR